MPDANCEIIDLRDFLQPVPFGEAHWGLMPRLACRECGVLFAIDPIGGNQARVTEHHADGCIHGGGE